jgi:hypothetical protein
MTLVVRVCPRCGRSMRALSWAPAWAVCGPCSDDEMARQPALPLRKTPRPDAIPPKDVPTRDDSR